MRLVIVTWIMVARRIIGHTAIVIQATIVVSLFIVWGILGVALRATVAHGGREREREKNREREISRIQVWPSYGGGNVGFWGLREKKVARERQKEKEKRLEACN